MAKKTDPQIHPLTQWLGGEWTWTENVSNGTTQLTHEGGLWTVMHTESMGPETGDEAQWAAIGEALNKAAKDGSVGMVVVTIHKADDGSYRAWIDDVLNEPREHRVSR